MRHTPPRSLEVTGLQCKFEPGHDGDHCAYAGFGQGDAFWPQDAPAPETRDGSGGGGTAWPPPGVKVAVT